MKNVVYSPTLSKSFAFLYAESVSGEAKCFTKELS